MCHVIIDPQTHNVYPNWPICEALNVKAGEPFRINYPKGMTRWMRIIPSNGQIESAEPCGKHGFRPGNCIAYGIQHPEDVVCASDVEFTDTELRVLRAFARQFSTPVVTSRREWGLNVLYLVNSKVSDEQGVRLTYGLLPSFPPSTSMDVTDILDKVKARKKAGQKPKLGLSVCGLLDVAPGQKFTVDPRFLRPMTFVMDKDGYAEPVSECGVNFKPGRYIVHAINHPEDVTKI